MKRGDYWIWKEMIIDMKSDDGRDKVSIPKRCVGWLSINRSKSNILHCSNTIFFLVTLTFSVLIHLDNTFKVKFQKRN